MPLQPVIERELRVQARTHATYGLRLLAALSAIAALGLCLIENPNGLRQPGRGPWLFALLHTSICFFFAPTCPLMIADTLSRERREGTLGILLLTPLNPRSIVFGKVTVHLVRALTMWLAILPMLMIPTLLGGVSLIDVCFALALETGVVFGGLSAGLIASSFMKQAGPSMAVASLLAALIGEALAMVSFLGLWPSLVAHPTSDFSRNMFFTALFGPWFFGTGLLDNGFSGALARNPVWIGVALRISLAAVFGGSLLIFAGAIRLAVARVKRMGAFGVLSAVQERRRRFWLRRLTTRRSRIRGTARLEKNPAFWLFTTQTTSGLNRWGWCATGILVWAGVFLAGYDDRDTRFSVFGWPIFLVGALGLVSAIAFNLEIEGRLLELLVVSPVQPRTIVAARLRALWRDFTPALLLGILLGTWWVVVNDYPIGPSLGLLLLVGCSFVSLPLIGLRVSLRGLNPLAAWGWVLAVGVLVPASFAHLLGYATEPAYGQSRVLSYLWTFASVFVPVQLALGVFSVKCAIADLATRRFQLRARAGLGAWVHVRGPSLARKRQRVI